MAWHGYICGWWWCCAGAGCGFVLGCFMSSSRLNSAIVHPLSFPTKKKSRDDDIRNCYKLIAVNYYIIIDAMVRCENERRLWSWKSTHERDETSKRLLSGIITWNVEENLFLFQQIEMNQLKRQVVLYCVEIIRLLPRLPTLISSPCHPFTHRSSFTWSLNVSFKPSAKRENDMRIMAETSPIPLRIVANAPFSLLEWIRYLHRIMRVACALETSLCGKMLEVLWLWLFHREIALFIHQKLLFHHRQCWQQLRSNKSLSFHFVRCCTNRKMLSDSMLVVVLMTISCESRTLIGEKNCTPNHVEKFFPVILYLQCLHFLDRRKSHNIPHALDCRWRWRLLFCCWRCVMSSLRLMRWNFSKFLSVASDFLPNLSCSHRRRRPFACTYSHRKKTWESFQSVDVPKNEKKSAGFRSSSYKSS